MREMKYIVTRNEEGKEEIFVFPKSVNHDCMAEVLGFIKNQTYGNWSCVFRKPVSAGFTDGKTFEVSKHNGQLILTLGLLND